MSKMGPFREKQSGSRSVTEMRRLWVSKYLRETNDFAGDVARVPGHRNLPHDVRQDANDAHA